MNCNNCGNENVGEVCNKCGMPFSNNSPNTHNQEHPHRGYPPSNEYPPSGHNSHGYPPPHGHHPHGYPPYPPHGYPPHPPPYGYQPQGKSKVAAGLLAILLGYGIHYFYLGYISKGIIQLCMWIGGFIFLIAGFVLFGIAAESESLLMLTVGLIVLLFSSAVLLAARIWELVDGIRILAGNLNVDGKGNPLVQ